MLATSLRPQTAFAARQATSLRRPSRVQRTVGVYAHQQGEERSFHEKLALPAAALMGAALLFAATPDAAEAARSGGRVGGSSGFRSAPRAAAPRSSASSSSSSSSRTIIRNNTYIAPPVFGGYGFGMPFGGFGGFGVMPVFGLGTLFNIMLLGIIIQVVFSVISGFTNEKKKADFKDDDW
ncbi:hypothetical protein ACK3TF_002116 [Chlorella vulgaris]